jgi:hypothetical protein
MRLFLLVVIALLGLAAAAERVVLVEDFTNSGCGPCWSFEPTLNSFVNSHLAAGDIAVIRVHTNWPSATDPIYLANPVEQQARWGFYNVSGVPTVKVDGIVNGYPGIAAAYATREAVPCYLDIYVCRNPSADPDTGLVSIRLIAEQDLGAGATTRVFATLVEDGVTGAGYWSGSEFEQAFRDNLLGPAGPVVAFSAPYPDTVFVEADYALSPSWDPASLHLVVFVQEYAAAPNKEVMNSFYGDFLDLPTGIGDSGDAAPEPVIVLVENPCTGLIRFSAGLAPGQTAVARVYDLSGRCAGETLVSGTDEAGVEVREAGVYLVRMECGPTSASRSVVVLD